jgi:hypothetical protein
MPFDVDTANRSGLADTAYRRVQDAFANFRPTPHAPSQAQLDAIGDLLDALEAAADGRLSRHAHVSAIPPGTGKSVSVQTFAATLCDAPDRTDVGMLVLVNRINEARDMAEALAHYRDRLCILTSDFRVNSMGDHAVADKAQVLVTTQERLRRTLKSLYGLPFEAASTLTYRGTRRAVVAWDEQLAFNRPVVLDPNKATALLETLQAYNWRHAHECLNRWSWECKDIEDGATIEVPDFGAEMPWEDLEEAVKEDDKLTSLAHSLRVISGDKVRVRRSGERSVVVTHYPELPATILPVVVTDASAEVNASYVKMRQKSSGTLSPPASPTRTCTFDWSPWLPPGPPSRARTTRVSRPRLCWRRWSATSRPCLQESRPLLSATWGASLSRGNGPRRWNRLSSTG